MTQKGNSCLDRRCRRPSGLGEEVLHVPAIKGLPGVKLAAVTTRNEQRARKADAAFWC